ncbi:hypothetical protein ASF23_09080 [Curtobacterium sp. Leaf261]|nr:hypothetical protein ASF23_09080 [Curtobacterium sp. Leaf261]
MFRSAAGIVSDVIGNVRRLWNWGMGLRDGSLVRFLGVGGLCFVLTLLINYALKFTVLSHKPVIAFLIATVITTVISYFLNRRWTFGQQVAGIWNWDMLRFAIVSGIGIVLNSAPYWVSRYVFHLGTPNVSVSTQEIADFISGPIIGTIIAMGFRYVAMEWWVFGRTGRKGSPEAVEQAAYTGTDSVPVQEPAQP